MASLIKNVDAWSKRGTVYGWRVIQWVPTQSARTVILILFFVWLLYLLYLRLWLPLSSIKELPSEVSATEVTVEVEVLQSLLQSQQQRRAHQSQLQAPLGLFQNVAQ